MCANPKNAKGLMYFFAPVKATRKILVKSTQGDDLINIFIRIFCMRGAQKREKDNQVISLFTLLGSACSKALRKYAGEKDPRPHFLEQTLRTLLYMDIK